jgi:Flp pilus assembly protein TadB
MTQLSDKPGWLAKTVVVLLLMVLILLGMALWIVWGVWATLWWAAVVSTVLGGLVFCVGMAEQRELDRAWRERA